MAPSSLSASRRDPAAFAAFYREQHPAVLRFFARRVIDAEGALDLTAETFAQAYMSRRRFRGETDQQARAWLFAIAQRRLSDYLRRGYAERRAMAKLGLERPVVEPDDLARVEELGEMRAVRELLVRQLEDLPAGCREAVRLRVIDELSYAEVAARLTISETAARMRVSRALGQLRTTMAPQAPVKEAG
jgi:RNA polymerase sigma-70 factor (ECF subfamily)